MPCYLVVTIQVKDYATLKKALEELGIKYIETKTHISAASFSYSIGASTLSCSNQSFANQLQQRMGVVQAESLARRKGVQTQRKQLQDGSIQLTLKV